VSVFDELIPDPLPPGVKVLYGTVTGSSPLRVQLAGDPGPLPITPTTTVATTVGDRVVILSHVRADNPDRRARAYVIVGVIGQGDTGWVSCTLNSGFTGTLTVRRLGSIVELQAAVDGTFPDGNSAAAGVIPAGFRPTGEHARLGGYISGGYPCIGYVVASSGSFGITQRTGTTHNLVYVRGMWTIG